MPTKPLIGGNTYNQALSDLRNAAEAQRQLLNKAMGPEVGPNLMTALLAKIIWQLSAIFSALSVLERIGQQEKNERTTEAP